MRAYYGPIVAFARERLVGERATEVHEVLVFGTTERPRLGDGVNLIVDPRARVGELRVAWVGPPFYEPGSLWAEARYCLHVVKVGARTTIAVEHLSSMIR